MILSAKAHIPAGGEPFIAVIEGGDGTSRALPPNRAVIASGRMPSHDVQTVLAPPGGTVGRGAIQLPDSLGYLGIGDIIRINPVAQEIRVIYRRESRSNSLLLTERCDSRCIMCPQPPRATDDGYLVDELLLALSLMDPDTPELGFSGGEPTLLGARFYELITAAKSHLPRTSLHVLSNGRAFAKMDMAQDLADANHPDLVIGIPLYADTASVHDFVVQAQGAFNETVLGLLNLGRLSTRIEIRVVLHRETYSRLPHLARFIARSFPFVEQVAFMGLEFMGYSKSNAKALWIDPREYAPQLEAAIETIETAGIRPLIFNLTHCVLPEQLWRFARQSISDWKNDFPDSCEPCPVRSVCCGCFDSSLRWYGPLLRPPAPAAPLIQ